MSPRVAAPARRCESGVARHPDASGVAIASDGIRLGFDTYGSGVVVEGADHMIPGRHPVLANLLVRDFVESLPRSAP